MNFETNAGHSAVDSEMMERCIHLSETSTQNGELPFAALICRGVDVVVEKTNQVVNHADITRHAELVAMSEAQKILKRKDLADCTLYTTVEPCAMCSFAIRETRIGRVVFAIRSPVMGGLSKWNVLRDLELSQALPEVFGPVPEVIAGLSRRKAEKVWSKWNPLFWSAMKFRGYLGGEAENEADFERLPAVRERRGLLRRLFDLHKQDPV
ncbi:MAG TPA: nucleoside deaminase [Candidatus Acidoferrum sp.]|nr:nucleoside deaminase [Candidatus Acidoferrum sp.]